MNKKKKMHPILKILLASFVVYIALFIASMSGYYEGQIRNKTTLTEEGIREFENIVKSGEKVDINSFLKNDTPDYSSKISKIGEYTSKTIEKLIFEGMDFAKEIFASLF